MAFAELVPGGSFHGRDRGMVSHITASLRVPDLPLPQQMAHRLPPGRVVCLLPQGGVQVESVRVPNRNYQSLPCKCLFLIPLCTSIALCICTLSLACQWSFAPHSSLRAWLFRYVDRRCTRRCKGARPPSCTAPETYLGRRASTSPSTSSEMHSDVSMHSHMLSSVGALSRAAKTGAGSFQQLHGVEACGQII